MKLMNQLVHKMNKKIAAVFLSFSLLISCGDPVTTLIVAQVIDAGVGGTGIVRGIITGFGSVYVNGVKFEVNDTAFDVDGDKAASQADLSIGMLVTINGTINADGVTGIATSLTYDDDIEGPISALDFVLGSDQQQKQIQILGYTIIVDALSTHYENTSYDTLALNDVIEISGYSIAPNTLVATLVEKKSVFSAGTTQVELKGLIANLDADSFTLNGVTVNYFLGTNLYLGNSQLVNGMFVEAEGTLLNDGSINADSIEQEDDEFSAEDGRISLSGTITDYESASSFKVNGQLIDISNAQELSPMNALSLLGNGVSIEVEGSIVNSIFVADEVEVKLKDIKISALVNSIDDHTLVLSFPALIGVINVVTDNVTQFEDESNADLSQFSLANIAAGNYLEIEAALIDGVIVATQIQRAELDDFILQGDIETRVLNTSITILGITYTVDSSTQYDGFLNALDFFNNTNIGDNVRIKDESGDGIADKVSLDD